MLETLMDNDPRVQLFKCSGCGLEVTLRSPVMRPCPGCGGEFEPVSDLLEMNEALRRRRDDIKERAIDRVVKSSMPSIIEGFEKLLREES